MENLSENNQNEKQSNLLSRDEIRRSWPLRVQASKNLWRRVFNKSIGAYEIYVRYTNILVATGISSKADSFAIATIPHLTVILQVLIEQIETERAIDENVLKELRNWLREYKATIVKRDGMDRDLIQRVDSPGLNLETTGGGSYEDVGPSAGPGKETGDEPDILPCP
jgi:hypothetical protein